MSNLQMLGLMYSISRNRSLPKSYRVPAEWEAQDVVYLAASQGNSFDPSQFSGVNKTILDVHLCMIKYLIDHVMVRIIANKDQQINVLKGMKYYGIDSNKVEFIPIPHCDIWLRDTGPIWAHTQKNLLPIWMGFNNWGYSDYIIGDWASCDIPNYIPRDLAKYLSIDVYRSSLIGEGGDKSFNGKGSLICCKAVETDRNPSLTLTQLEQLLKNTFNVTNIIWVEKGLADDIQSFRVQPEFQNANLPGGVYSLLGTGGHVDEFCRFVSESKILLAEVYEHQAYKMSPIDKITQSNLEENLKLLNKQKDQDGGSLKIIRMPLPPNMIYEIDQRDPVYKTLSDLKGVYFKDSIYVILAASYCNYLVSNDVICFPQYYHEGMDSIFKVIDAKAMAVIKSVFPRHKIIAIDPKPVNAGGGGMHCISNNQPRVL